MSWNRCANKGSFSVFHETGLVPVEGNVVFSNEIATTFEEKNKLLDEVSAFIGRSLVRMTSISSAYG